MAWWHIDIYKAIVVLNVYSLISLEHSNSMVCRARVAESGCSRYAPVDGKQERLAWRARQKAGSSLANAMFVVLLSTRIARFEVFIS